MLGHLGGSVVECLPLAQVVIPGSRDSALHWAPCSAGSLLLLLPLLLLLLLLLLLCSGKPQNEAKSCVYTADDDDGDDNPNQSIKHIY